MTTIYYAIRNKAAKQLEGGPYGTSQAPHLYLTKGKASGRYRRAIDYGTHEVVPVELTVPGDTYAERLHQEYDQLLGRLAKLRVFLKTDAYLNLPDIERNDLAHQEALMTNLTHILYGRLTRARTGNA